MKNTFFVIAAFAMTGMFVPFVAQNAAAASPERCIWNEKGLICNTIPEEGKTVDLMVAGRPNLENCQITFHDVVPDSPKTGITGGGVGCDDVIILWAPTPYRVVGPN